MFATESAGPGMLNDTKSLVAISTVKTVYTIDEDITVNIKVKNIFAKNIKVPADELYVGYRDDSHSDAVFEVEKIEGEVKIQRIPSGDYSYSEILRNGKIYKYLKKGRSKEYTFRLNRFYSLPKGIYRMRLNFFIPLINDLDVSTSYSNWSYFKII